jgi:hypothetical protein
VKAAERSTARQAPTYVKQVYAASDDRDYKKDKDEEEGVEALNKMQSS